MPVEGNQQPFGLLHGGATCSLVETIGSWAAILGSGPDRKAVGIELNASYVKAATSGVVTAVCTPVRRGRTLATFLIEVSDDQGNTTASARLTCMILPACARAAERRPRHRAASGGQRRRGRGDRQARRAATPRRASG